MTQLLLNISDKTILPSLKSVLKRMDGVEKVSVVRQSRQASKRKAFLDEFSEAVREAKNFKEGKTNFGSWEDMMNEL